ncbi:MAG: 5-oxoprolinase subunit B family protein [Sulfitobacter sp.]
MTDWPQIHTVGLSGVLVSFADKLSESANRSALAFRAIVDAQDWPEVSETSTSLVSTFLRVDLAATPFQVIKEKLVDLIGDKDWFSAPLPQGRTLWHVPTVYGTDLAPQLEEAAKVAGVDPDQALKELSETRVRVLTIGFAPGQPYLGELSETWNIPRQQQLTQAVPAGALVVAVKQLVVFTNITPTGWRHVGQTAFRTFRPDAEKAFALSPGDEMVFPQASTAEFKTIQAKDTSGNGGAVTEVLS